MRRRKTRLAHSIAMDEDRTFSPDHKGGGRHGKNRRFFKRFARRLERQEARSEIREQME